jgi:hypothetical protein
MGWQDGIVALVVLSAAMYVVRQTWYTFTPPAQQRGCGSGCARCSANSSSAGQPGIVGVDELVPLNSLAATRKE